MSSLQRQLTVATHSSRGAKLFKVSQTAMNASCTVGDDLDKSFNTFTTFFSHATHIPSLRTVHPKEMVTLC